MRDCQIEATLTTLAARLARLDRELEPAQRQQIVTASGGHTPASSSSLKPAPPSTNPRFARPSKRLSRQGTPITAGVQGRF